MHVRAALITCPRRPRSEILFVSHLSSGGLAPSGMALPPLLPRPLIGGGYCGGGCCCGLGEYSPRIPDGTKPKLVLLLSKSKFGTSSAYLSNALYTVHLNFRIFFPNSFNITIYVDGEAYKGPPPTRTLSMNKCYVCFLGV